MATASPITSVQPQAFGSPSAIASASVSGDSSLFPPSKYLLELRGARFLVDREILYALPETILAAMFPSGTITSNAQPSSTVPAGKKPMVFVASADTGKGEAVGEGDEAEQLVPQADAPTLNADQPLAVPQPSDAMNVQGETAAEADDADPRLDDQKAGTPMPGPDRNSTATGTVSNTSSSTSSASATSAMDMSVMDAEAYDDYVDLVYIDFDPSLFRYALSFYRGLLGFATGDQNSHDQEASEEQGGEEEGSSNAGSFSLFTGLQHPFFQDKRAVIVLREDLDYFAIIKSIDETILARHGTLPEIKAKCGAHLIDQRAIFTVLQRSQSEGVEQQLIEMLCASGFSRDSQWMHRHLEPTRNSVISMSLKRLMATGHPDQLVAAQKLLLFWRKPARKCWWDGMDISLGSADDDPCHVRLWCRRMWTLELVLV